jgi:two-component system LytT family response regulator/two-component system response regulator LytT
VTQDKTIRTLLVDDEPPAIDELSYLLSGYPDVEVVGTAGNAASAVELVRQTRPDLVFLDIQMPGKNGFHVLSEIMEEREAPLVVFITAYDEYAIRAFEENAVDYILKPVPEDRLRKSLERVRERLDETQENEPSSSSLQKLLAEVGIKPGIARVSVEHSGKNVLLNPREVDYFEYSSRRVYANTAGGEYPCQSDLTLDRLEARLGGFGFFRTNRSQLVNLSRVRAYAPWFNGKYVLTLDNAEETEITVSKARVREFKEAIEL